jgi:hypothetical protein
LTAFPAAFGRVAVTFFVVVGFSFEEACDWVPTEVDVEDAFAVGVVFRLLAMPMERLTRVIGLSVLK